MPPAFTAPGSPFCCGAPDCALPLPELSPGMYSYDKRQGGMSDQLCYFCEQEPPLTKRGEEELRLLQHAWNEYDVAKYQGHWYTITSFVLTFCFLALGFFTIIFIVILTAYCGDNTDDGSNSDDNSCYLPDDIARERQMERVIFCLTLLVTFVVALDECIKPAEKAMHLKRAAEKLKSWIWLYR